MAERKSRWTNILRSRLPRARQRSHSDPPPSPSPVVESHVPASITSAQVITTSSVPMVTMPTSVPQATKVEEKPAISVLKTVLEGLKSSLNELPHLQLAVGALLECILYSQMEAQNCQAFDELASDLTELATLLQKHIVESKPRNVPYSIANVARAMREQILVIKEHQDRSRISRLASALEDEGVVLKCYRRIGALFKLLQVDVSLSVWDVLREQQMDTRLKDLSPAHDARYNAALPATVTKRAECTKGTRVELLEDARDWTRDEGGTKVYWMNGMAGTGKTTIAYTMCKMLYDNKQLGGSFFCSRNPPDFRDVNRIIPTIAYQLGRYSNPYRQVLCGILEDDPDVAKQDISVQFERLISKPLGEISKAMPTDVVVVIDALDECTDVGGTKDVLSLLLRHAGNLPIKFFISSRPEPAISNRIAAPGGAVRSILRLHDIEQSLVQEDIKTYLTEALESIEATPSEIDHFAARAGSLFIFAATAVRYILPDIDSIDHRRRLLTILGLHSNQGNKSYRDIDELYIVILSNALDENRLEKSEIDEGDKPSTRWSARENR